MSRIDELIIVAEGMTRAVVRHTVSKMQCVRNTSRGAWQGVEQDMVVKETHRGVVDIEENLEIGLILLKD